MLGKTFGRLTVICKSQKTRNGNRYYWTVCSCGNLHIVVGYDLKQGHTKSCGCLLREVWQKNIKLATIARIKHRMCKTRIYSTWNDMHTRCNNPNCKFYKNYGGRGISICREWKDFITFKNWAYANGYRSNLTIDRINNNGNYEPSNCQWITGADNARKGIITRQKAQYKIRMRGLR